MPGSRVVWWLPAAAAAFFCVLAARSAYAADAGSRAGAEPVLAAILVGVPFALLALIDAAACAVQMTGAERATVPWLWLLVTAVGAVTLFTGVVVLDGTPGYGHDVLAAVLLLVPVAISSAWIVACRRPFRGKRAHRV